MKNLMLLSLAVFLIFFSCKKHNDIPDPVPSSDASILTFSIQNQISATINQTAHTISVIIPFGSEIDSLIALFSTAEGSTVTMDSVTQVSGVTVNNFSVPKTYTVTAEDGTTKIDWIVTVDYETYTYLSTDFPAGGNTYLMNVDTSGFSSFSLGTAGKGKIWSFTGLESNIVDTVKFSIASQHPSYSHFPGTSFVYSDNNLPFEMFGSIKDQISPQQAEFSGIHVEYSGMIFDLPLNNNFVQMEFPAEIGSVFTDHGSVTKDTLTTVPGFPFPVNVTIKVDFDITSNVDANGIITTPLGSFKCLRQFKEQITNIQALVYNVPIPGYGGSDTLRTYNFINKEKAFPVVIVDVNANGNILKIKHLQ